MSWAVVFLSMCMRPVVLLKAQCCSTTGCPSHDPPLLPASVTKLLLVLLPVLLLLPALLPPVDAGGTSSPRSP